MHKGNSGLFSACEKGNASACIILGLKNQWKCDTETLLSSKDTTSQNTYMLFSILYTYPIVYPKVFSWLSLSSYL